MLKQPSAPRRTPSDAFYFRLSNRLATIIESRHLLAGWDQSLRLRVALALTGYIQDILTDAGIWRSFTERCHVLYGCYVPFYPEPEDYIPHELNEIDVRFLIWYTLSMNSDERRVWNPADPAIEEASRQLHAELDRVYDDPDTPMPDDYNIAKGLEVANPEEADEVFHFGHWLFMHCYLMTPAYAMTLAQIMSDPELRKGQDMERLRKVLEESMMDDPTGPLALYLHEWLYLILEGKMPPAPKRSQSDEEEAEDHPWYTAFMRANDGVPIRFFHTYAELNRFFIEALGWDEGENLPHLKNASDFVLLVNQKKGMLCAAGVAKCIRLPENPCYDAEFARENAIDLLTVRGVCPADLLHYVLERKGLPDAHFPGTADAGLVERNADFIARCYLQKYYRGD